MAGAAWIGLAHSHSEASKVPSFIHAAPARVALGKARADRSTAPGAIDGWMNMVMLNVTPADDIPSSGKRCIPAAGPAPIARGLLRTPSMLALIRCPDSTCPPPAPAHIHRAMGVR
ncbi:hypothetical protein GCM10009126_22770 [Rhodanobacter caeni]|uniref:Uncharacterized protein n=1 Tax=Rhodanobacter caeni TaxID=657654 RepID=A0ABN0UPD9_9GAMM